MVVRRSGGWTSDLRGNHDGDRFLKLDVRRIVKFWVRRMGDEAIAMNGGVFGGKGKESVVVGVLMRRIRLGVKRKIVVA
jgi:hypothetical protein